MQFFNIHIIVIHTPGKRNTLVDLLFSRLVHRSKGLVPWTDSVACKHLKDISRSLCLDKILTFHNFRRAGAAWAFSDGVPLEHIMKHCTWKSDAIWTYLSFPALHPLV